MAAEVQAAGAAAFVLTLSADTPAPLLVASAGVGTVADPAARGSIRTTRRTGPGVFATTPLDCGEDVASPTATAT